MIKPVQITFRNRRPSVPLEDEIRARVAWLERFSPDLVGCRVVLEVPHRHQKRGRPVSVRIELSLPGEDAIVSNGPTLHGHLKDMQAEEHRKDGEVDAAHKDAIVAIHEAFARARRRIEDLTRRQRGDVKTHLGPSP